MPTILITGTSSGIGRATAKHFSSKGWNVVATMRNPGDAGDLADEALVLPLDVTARDGIDRAVKDAVDAFGRLDVVVNNAGYAVIGALEAVSAEQIERQFAVNVFGAMAVTQAVLPRFRAQNGGTIVNISSIVGRFTYPLGAVYDASKFAIEGFSEAMRFELEAIGARMKIVEPGLIASDFGTRSMQFAHDPSLTAYRPLVDAMGAMAAKFADMAEPADVVAEAVWQAATDGTDALRYPAGQAAHAALTDREQLDDLAFHARTKERFGL
ncbi:MAG: SDR family oxidoreductase [Pseudomonadota bacterium]